MRRSPTLDARSSQPCPQPLSRFPRRTRRRVRSGAGPGVRRLQRRVPRHHAPRAAALRSARLARQPARCGRAHRALRQVRQSRRRADARAARRGRDRARAVEQHQAPLHRADRRAARPASSTRRSSTRSRAARSARSASTPRSSSSRSTSIRSAAITSQIETNVYVNRGSLELLFEEVLADFRFRTPYLDFDRSVRIITNEVRAQCEADSDASRPPLQVEQIEFIRTVFYQMTRAYLVGRISGKGWMLPFVLALKNTESGVLIDAVMMDESQRQHPVQLHALVLPRRPAARRPGGRVPQEHPAAQAGERAVHGARPRQAGQDRALSRAVPPPAAEHRSVRARARRQGPGDDLLHAALVRRGVQDHPRPLRLSEEHPARGSAEEVRAGVQARPRRPAGRCAGVQAPAVPDGALLPTR